ncbi:MAG TPA: NAD-dependent epimerase/dehydratase family protein, partial [Acidimicrobiales bacterium]|nr:NAD-dependent epimerase/dehydratase family protein [Acidimicrobiales bacterium]
MTSTTGSPILVTGGTGTLGGHVVPRLRAAGHDVRVLSRHPHEDDDGVIHVVADLATGEGADAALEGIEVVLHLAGSSSGDEDKARHL